MDLLKSGHNDASAVREAACAIRPVLKDQQTLGPLNRHNVHA